MLSRGFLSNLLRAGLLLVLVLALPPAVRADTVDVSIPGLSFNPAIVTITAGTTVRWTNNHAMAHTSTADGGLWNSGTLNTGQKFSFTFATVGSFPYHCEFHPGMIGTVTVDPAPATTKVPALGPFGTALLILAIAAGAVLMGRRRAHHKSI